MRRPLLAVVLFLSLVQPAAGAHFSLVEARPAAMPFLQVAGAEELSPSIRLWRLDSALVPQLRRAGLLRLAQPERRLAPALVRAVDPLQSTEWWMANVGADSAQPPGPGVPVTVIDTGIDVTHPEFAGRPDTTALNTQVVTNSAEDFHGTAVASLVAAPANGVGIVGVYPQAVLRSYDADLSGHLTDAELIRGIEAAAQAGPSVINLSLGGTQFDEALQDEIYSVFRRGSLVVAASGNSKDEGNPINFPANMSHVLTVAATTENDVAASFSSSSPGVDLAAPGVDIPAAVPLSYDASGYATLDGTSFSAPIVSGATAWVWTVRRDLDNTQIFDLMRWSARDVGPRGFDNDTGWGILDIPNALTMPAPPRDPEEPNDDIFLVKPGVMFAHGEPPLTTTSKSSATLRARLDVTEDPEDVYRVYVPAHKTVSVTVHGTDNVDLELWKPATSSVLETGMLKKGDLAGSSDKLGTAPDTVSAQNPGKRGAYYYADVFPGRGVGTASYTLSVKTHATARR